MKDDLIERLIATGGKGQGGSLKQKAAGEIRSLRAENERLREIISKCATALGNGAHIDPGSTVEFMGELPREIELRIAALKDAECDALRAILGEYVHASAVEERVNPGTKNIAEALLGSNDRLRQEAIKVTLNGGLRHEG